MAETQTTASVQIDEPVSSSVSKHVYKIILKDEAGQPVSGEEVSISMTGSGGFEMSFASDAIKRTTDDAGEATFTWYRRGIFTRGVKATVTAEAGRAGTILSLERVTELPPDVSMSWVKTEFKLPPPRV